MIGRNCCAGLVPFLDGRLNSISKIQPLTVYFGFELELGLNWTVSVDLCFENGSVRTRFGFKAQPMRALAGVIVALWLEHSSGRSRSGLKVQSMRELAGSQARWCVLHLFECQTENKLHAH